jgi:glycosyltransferase involved in cell wall biosynthesis
MARVLIDLTDIELWSGNHGGTQRVVYGIAKYFYLQHETPEQEVRFVSFAPKEKRFYFTDFSPIYRRVEKLEPAHHVEEIEPPEPPPGRKQRFKMAMKPFVPASIRRNQAARRAAQVIVRTVATPLRRALPEEKGKETSSPARNWVRFTPDDIVLVLGKPWDNLDIQATLGEQRTQYHFKLVQIVYDLIICLYPHLHHPTLVQPYTQNMLGALENSDLLLPISVSTDRDLKAFGKIHKRKIPKAKVIRLGEDIATYDPEVKLQKPDARIVERFVACVGTVEVRKNHTLLYYAYKLAAERGIDMPQMVVVGGQGWLSGDIQHLIATDPAIKEKIILLHTVDDAGLLWIYKHCLFTVYPSMYEGWGLPVAESLARGKLCVATSASSVPEIAGGLIDYFSPCSPEECMQKITHYLNDAARHKKEKAIQSTYVPTRWEQTYGQVQDYIKTL